MFSYLSLTGRLCTCQRAFRSHNVLVKAAYLIWRLPRHKVWIQRWAPNSGTSSHTCSSLESNYIYCTLWPIQSHSFPLQCEKHVTEVMDLSEFCLLTFIFLDRRIKCSLLDWQNVVTSSLFLQSSQNPRCKVQSAWFEKVLESCFPEDRNTWPAAKMHWQVGRGHNASLVICNRTYEE